MLIFHRFPSMESAEAFRRSVVEAFPERRAWLFMTQEDAQLAEEAGDVFPFLLTPPIVHVERTLGRAAELDEVVIERTVHRWGGQFAGT